MATVKSKIILKQGNIVDLPILDAGEQGYATDVNRLFIGNPVIMATVADVAGVLTAAVPVDLDLVQKYEVWFGQLNITPTTEVDNFVLTINDAAVSAGDEIVVKYNTEILTYQPDREMDTPQTITLIGSNSANITAVSFAEERYNNAEIKYSLRDDINNHVRTGTMTITLFNGTHNIMDNYVTDNHDLMPHVFGGSVVDGVFILNYSTLSTANTEFTYVTNYWKS